uniref:Histone acetyltransferase n=1 Tax=Hevea brasiliensis TaxID=3981 RepID=A0A2D0XZ63_HEVBR|nr:histone acetyltransferase [Hevea brasiliensis]
MAILSSYPSPLTISLSITCPNFCNSLNSTAFLQQSTSHRFHIRPIAASQVCTPHEVDKSSLIIAETEAEDELWAASCLRVRSFYEFTPSSYGLQDHKRYLAEREFEAVKERIAGKRTGFRRVSCINATLPLSQLSSLSEDLCAECKHLGFGVYVDLSNKFRVSRNVFQGESAGWQKREAFSCLRSGENGGKGIGADFMRAYLSNVCVAKELQRHGLGYELVAESKIVAQEWGISDLYVHVAFENEPAKKLYTKSGFIYENDEPAWQARFLDRPRRLLLWIGISGGHDL